MEGFGSSCNFMSFENNQITKQPTIHLPMNMYETSFLPDNSLINISNLSMSVSNESNSSYTCTSKAVFTIHLPSFQILVVNSAACQILNYRSDELYSMKLCNLVKDSHKVKLSNLYEKFLKSGSEIPHSNEKLLEFVRKDGEILSGLIYLKKIENHEKCLAIVEPIENKTGLVSVDKSGNILSFDEDIALLFCYDPSEIIGINICVLLPGIKLSKRNAENWKETSKQQLTGRTKHGEAFPISLMISSGNPNTEQYRILICVYTNLSGLILLNKRLMITSSNNYFTKFIFGLSKKDIINQPIFDLIPTFCKDIGFEKNKKSNYKSNVANDTSLSSWYERYEFEDWGENSTTGDECMTTVKSDASFVPFGNFKLSLNQNGAGPDRMADYETDHGLKTLFTQEKVKAENEEQKCSKYSYSSFLSGDHLEEKISLNPVIINKIGKNNPEPGNNMFDCYSTSDQNIVVQEGKFIGFAQHSDGNCIPIKYQVKITAVSEESFYCVRISNGLFRFPDESKRLKTNIVFSLNSTSLDGSLLKENFCSGQCTRPSTASLVSQSDETLTAGDYSEHYTNIRRIGKGAFGYVKMAFRNSDGLLVVTKFIKKQKINIRSWVFHSNLNMKIPLEISLLTTLHHPNIVKVLDVFHNDSFVQLVMEKHGAGFDLFEFINRGPNCDEKLKSYIFRQIISAVYYLDSLGILHRDIKDENVIINEKFEIKLIDFGSATFIPPNETFSKFYGTVEYCSPEVLQGNSYKGPELEIWALGVTLYVLAFGDNPFHNIEETIRGQFSIPFPISKELDYLLNRMLDKNVETRISIDKVVKDPWINQPVAVENYRFEEVVLCSDEEAYPPKYVHEINSEDLFARDSKTDSNLLGDRNNSCCSLHNLAEMDDLDDNFQQTQKSFKFELSGSKTSIPSFMLSSTPISWRKDRLSKSESGVPENFRNSSSSDCSCECRYSSFVEKESDLRKECAKYFRSTSSSENDCGGVNSGIILPSFNDICESDLEVRNSFALTEFRAVENECRGPQLNLNRRKIDGGEMKPGDLSMSAPCETVEDSLSINSKLYFRSFSSYVLKKLIPYRVIVLLSYKGNFIFYFMRLKSCRLVEQENFKMNNSAPTEKVSDVRFMSSSMKTDGENI